MTKNSNVLEGIECPKCGGQGPFRGNITAYGTAYISDDGWDDLRTEETDFSGPFKCSDCGLHFDPYEPEGEPVVEMRDLFERERCGVFDDEIQQVLDDPDKVEFLDAGGGHVARKDPETGEVWLACWVKINKGGAS
jgi:rubredoxin